MRQPDPHWKLHIRAYGLLQQSYIGLNGQRSTYTRRYLVCSSTGKWVVSTAADIIERFMQGTRQCWPDWLPPQKPIFETYFHP